MLVRALVGRARGWERRGCHISNSWVSTVSVVRLVGKRSMAAIARSEGAGQGTKLQLASWNLAAINNNPFEYWVTHEDEAYNDMMAKVARFISSPGESDVKVETVFTNEMFAQLKDAMLKHGWAEAGVLTAERMWEQDFRSRLIVSGFMKDATIGDKRLASMPDRITNTINLANGGQAFRPTPINCFPGTFASKDDWWQEWTRFMFETPLQVNGKQGVKSSLVADMLVPIQRSKYPAVTEEEEKASLPLQALCNAIFDAVLVHMLETIAPGKWQQLRHDLSNALNRNKNARTLAILDEVYGNADIVFLQEVANAFAQAVQSHASLRERYLVIAPSTKMSRDQLSVVLVRRSILAEQPDFVDVTSQVYKSFEGKSVPVDEGDVVAAALTLKSGLRLLLASFHGDTNGLATLPVLEAVHELASQEHKDSSLLFGLDANTYRKGKPGKTYDVGEFGQAFRERGMSSCWGDVPNPTFYTTYNARTYLQTQLNKAASKDEFATKGDVNPKDFILFYKKQFAVDGEPTRDNTGMNKYVEDMPFPTLSFPSDHAVIAATVRSVL